MAIATPVNPRKKFAWTVEFEGLEKALVQRVNIPDLEIEVAEHGSSNILVKTGGMVKVGDITLSKLQFANKVDSWAYNWFNQVSNVERGVIGIPSEYKKNGYIIQLGPDLVSVLEKWQVIGCFPKMVKKEEFEAGSSDNLIEEVTLSVDYIVRKF